MIPIPSGSALAPTAFFYLFPNFDDLPRSGIILPESIPEPYRRLLDHHEHMTITIEEFYQDLVDVEVLETQRHGDSYSRKILLSLRQSKRVVQFGIVRIDLSYCRPEVATAILAEDTPLGRVLIEHDIFRRIEHTGFLKIEPSTSMNNWFENEQTETCYGRMGVIFCDGNPAIEVLEILAPVL